jgi:hypothetical protein
MRNITAPIYDPYFFMLENPEHRDFSGFSLSSLYQSCSFDLKTYAESRKTNFASVYEGYLDWLETGRANGLSYAQGRNTMLKILLKCKDEPELIDAWIDHHESIVGQENIILMNCGSVSPHFVSKLDDLRQKYMVINYPKYYNHLHSVNMNRDFYRALSRESRYLAILDADEFLYGFCDGVLSKKFVLDYLIKSNPKYACGTWLHNILPPILHQGKICLGELLEYSARAKDLLYGTRNGKALVRTDILLETTNIGHNLHQVDSIKTFISKQSFGRIFILHLNDLPVSVKVRRLCANLASIAGLSSYDVEKIQKFESSDVLIDLAGGKDRRVQVKRYAQELLRLIQTDSAESTLDPQPLHDKTLSISLGMDATANSLANDMSIVSNKLGF